MAKLTPLNHRAGFQMLVPGIRYKIVYVAFVENNHWEQLRVCGRLVMSRRPLEFSGGSVDDYATFSTSTLSPSC